MARYKRRTRNLYNPASDKPFSLSRSRAARFLECPRCFYLDRRLGFDRPDMPGWSLNSAVDHLLKNEFDGWRRKKEPHPMMTRNGIDAVPLAHPDLRTWRDDFQKYVGASVLHQETNLILTGSIDDLLINPAGEWHVIDYKSTSSETPPSLDGEYRSGYKTQVEWYQWVFRQMGHPVSDTAYFVFANGLRGYRLFFNRLEFEVTILAHEGSDTWVEPAIFAIKDCLESDTIPDASPTCDYCDYRHEIGQATSD